MENLLPLELFWDELRSQVLEPSPYSKQLLLIENKYVLEIICFDGLVKLL